MRLGEHNRYIKRVQTIMKVSEILDINLGYELRTPHE